MCASRETDKTVTRWSAMLARVFAEKSRLYVTGKRTRGFERRLNELKTSGSRVQGIFRKWFMLPKSAKLSPTTYVTFERGDELWLIEIIANVIAMNAFGPIIERQWTRSDKQRIEFFVEVYYYSSNKRLLLLQDIYDRVLRIINGTTFAHFPLYNE